MPFLAEVLEAERLLPGSPGVLDFERELPRDRGGIRHGFRHRGRRLASSLPQAATPAVNATAIVPIASVRCICRTGTSLSLKQLLRATQVSSLFGSRSDNRAPDLPARRPPSLAEPTVEARRAIRATSPPGSSRRRRGGRRNRRRRCSTAISRLFGPPSSRRGSDHPRARTGG